MPDFCDKYHPNNFTEVVGNEEEIKILRGYIKKKDVSHLLFSGPSGTGKSACAHLVSKRRLGKYFPVLFREMNTSDERGINIVREDIKDFARTGNPTMDVGDEVKKILYLSEVDSITPEAQFALRRTLEVYNDNFEVIMSCNYPEKLIEAIKSRCMTFEFLPLTNRAVLTRLQYIMEQEEIEIEKKALRNIASKAKGDMRRGIKLLEKLTGLGRKITLADTEVKSNVSEDVARVIDCVFSMKFMEGRRTMYNLITRTGLNFRKFTRLLHDELIDMAKKVAEKGTFPLPMLTKMLIAMKECDWKLSQGGEKILQLDGLLAELVSIYGRGAKKR